MGVLRQQARPARVTVYSSAHPADFESYLKRRALDRHALRATPCAPMAEAALPTAPILDLQRQRFGKKTGLRKGIERFRKENSPRRRLCRSEGRETAQTEA